MYMFFFNMDIFVYCFYKICFNPEIMCDDVICDRVEVEKKMSHDDILRRGQGHKC